MRWWRTQQSCRALWAQVDRVLNEGAKTPEQPSLWAQVDAALNAVVEEAPEQPSLWAPLGEVLNAGAKTPEQPSLWAQVDAWLPEEDEGQKEWHTEMLHKPYDWYDDHVPEWTKAITPDRGGVLAVLRERLGQEIQEEHSSLEQHWVAMEGFVANALGRRKCFGTPHLAWRSRSASECTVGVST